MRCYCSEAGTEAPVEAVDTSNPTPSIMSSVDISGLSLKESIALLQSKAAYPPKAKVKAELRTLFLDPAQVRKLHVNEAADGLSLAARLNVIEESSSDAVLAALHSYLLSNLHGASPAVVVRAIASLVPKHMAAAKSLYESAIPLITAKSHTMNIRTAKLTVALCCQLQLFDRLVFQAMEAQLVELLRTADTKTFLETMQFLGKAKFTPSSIFFEQWPAIYATPAKPRGAKAQADDAKAATSTEGESATEATAAKRDIKVDDIISTLESLKMMRRKPAAVHKFIDDLANMLKPLVKEMYITDVTKVVALLADLHYIQPNVPRSFLNLREKNENKIFSPDCLVVALAERTLELKDKISIDLLKDLTYGFASMQVHYFRLWLFFAEKVKAVVGEIEPNTLVSIVKHMARAKFCDQQLWNKIVPHLLTKVPHMPPPAISLWSDAIVSTITAKMSKKDDFGEAIKTSALGPNIDKLLSALLHRNIELLRMGAVDDSLVRATRHLERTIEIFFPMGNFEGLDELAEAKQDYTTRRRAGTTVGRPNTEKPELESADAALHPQAAKVEATA